MKNKHFVNETEKCAYGPAEAESSCNLGVFIAASKSLVKVNELRRTPGPLKALLPLGTLSN